MIDPISSLLGIALVLGAPGPTNALLAAAGGEGLRRSPLAPIAAVLAGYAVSITVLRLVGAPAIAAVPALGPGLRLVLALYLLFLGCCLWRRPPSGAPDATLSPRRILVATLLNPKAAIFAFALFPEETAGPALLAWALGFAGVVIAGSAAWFFVGERTRRWGGAAATHLVPRVASVILVGFALFVAAGTVAAIV